MVQSAVRGTDQCKKTSCRFLFTCYTKKKTDTQTHRQTDRQTKRVIYRILVVSYIKYIHTKKK